MYGPVMFCNIPQLLVGRKGIDEKSGRTVIHIDRLCPEKIKQLLVIIGGGRFPAAAHHIVDGETATGGLEHAAVMGAECDLIDHVKTQLPYACVNGVIAFAAFLLGDLPEARCQWRLQ